MVSKNTPTAHQDTFVADHLPPLGQQPVFLRVADFPGRLAVRGPTGYRYLADERQVDYVVDGWNLTGDLFTLDDEGLFWFQGRVNDLIVSSGDKIAAREVEEAILSHPAVGECAVVGVADKLRGNVVKAVVVPRTQSPVSTTFVRELQNHVKNRIAPYKYPRIVELRAELPKTLTGRVQHFALRSQGEEESL